MHCVFHREPPASDRFEWKYKRIFSSLAFHMMSMPVTKSAPATETGRLTLDHKPQRLPAFIPQEWEKAECLLGPADCVSNESAGRSNATSTGSCGEYTRLIPWIITSKNNLGQTLLMPTETQHQIMLSN